MKINGKRVAALVLALFMAKNSGLVLKNNLSAKADTISTPITLQTQKESQLTLQGYEELVISSNNYLSQFINYDNMMKDLQSYIFIDNIEYISRELEQKLIDLGYIFNSDVNSEEFWYNFDNAESLKDKMADYDQSTIHYQYLYGQFDSNKLIDTSIMHYNSSDSEAANQLFEEWFNAYQTGRFDSESFIEGFKQLTALNAFENGKDIYDSSVGARFFMWMFEGGNYLQMMRDYATDKWTQDELAKYFDKGMLLKSQWQLRDDVSIDRECIEKGSLEEFVLYYGQLSHCVYEIIYNDIYNQFGARCENKTK